VDDHVARVDQHPVGGLLAFHLGQDAVLLLEAVGELLGDGGDLAGGPA
jgi:hypothetical protein